MSNSGMTTIEVKRINRSKVYQMIYEKRSISKQELAQELHMGLTTVTQNLKALKKMVGFIVPVIMNPLADERHRQLKLFQMHALQLVLLF